MPKAKKKASPKKLVMVAEVVLKGNPDKMPDFGLGTGIILSKELEFTDKNSRGFDSPIFQASLIDLEDQLMKEAVEVRFVKKKK